MKDLSLRKTSNNDKGWIAVDLDGTLAEYQEGYVSEGKIGDPIPKMMDRVKRWLKEGKKVKIFTARAKTSELIPPIEEWLEKHGLGDLEITNEKDMHLTELWDDRAIQIIKNTGERIDGKE